MTYIQCPYTVFRHHNFLEGFCADLDNAKGLVLMQSPYMKISRVNLLREHLVDCRRRNVQICLFVEKPPPPRAGDQQSALWYASKMAAQEVLAGLGVHITYVGKIHEKLAIIDEELFWEGSLNIFSHLETSETMNRWVGIAKVQWALEEFVLGKCAECREQLGHYVHKPDAKTRMKVLSGSIKEMRLLRGWNQTELARRLNMRRAAISEIERDCSKFRILTLKHVCDELGIGLILAPWWRAPRLLLINQRRMRRIKRLALSATDKKPSK